jgi:hypothetical protein
MASSSTNQGQVRVRSTHPSEENPLLRFTRCAAIPATIAKQEQLQHRLAVARAVLSRARFNVKKRMTLRAIFLHFFF